MKNDKENGKTHTEKKNWENQVRKRRKERIAERN